MKIVTVIGARPQFIKAATISKKIRLTHEEIILHTGQHYNSNMSGAFFEELNIPRPDYNLGIGSGNHGKQTGRMLEKIEEVILDEKPDCVIVYGDTNSTLAGALAASKLNIPVVHVESGLRSYNHYMPEEQNRVLTDHISTLLMCPTKTAVNNLFREGIVKGVYNTGDVMYDAVLYNARLAKEKHDFSFSLKSLIPLNDKDEKKVRRLSTGEYYLSTIHRAENTNIIDKLRIILNAFNNLDYPVLFPIHPRTKKLLDKRELDMHNILYIEPVTYLKMIILTINAKKVLTDSGGLQKEAYFLDTPCVTLRDQTEWLETLEGGWNILSSINKEEIIEKVQKPFIIDKKQRKDVFGDGKAAEKIVKILEDTIL
jgi:UDP-GlcNAc3NAcA epimerase